MNSTASTQSGSAARPARVLVVEDQADLREAIVSYLALEAVSASGVGTLAQARAWCAHNEFDVLILDLGLPDGDGIDWLQTSGLLGSRGVLILSARGSPPQRLAGLRAGADAYLVKPVPLEELALQVRRLSDRVLGWPAPDAAAIRPSAWQLSSRTWILTAPNGRELQLKHTELQLLQALMNPAGEVLSKEQVVESQGADPDRFDYRRVETLIRRLRQRCREVLGLELPIQTIYGRGLAFTEPAEVVRGLNTAQHRQD
jgi:DNA-binding response OmpR family regulator